MPVIILKTIIKAERAIVFDLHKISTRHTSEKAIAGKTDGLIGLNESVTWKARHFGVYQTLTSKITEFHVYTCFVDEMVAGAFKSFRHEHRFSDVPEGTLMSDRFAYESPYGFLGRLANHMFLNAYMANLLNVRNQIIKEFAETDKWKTILEIHR